MRSLLNKSASPLSVSLLHFDRMALKRSSKSPASDLSFPKLRPSWTGGEYSTIEKRFTHWLCNTNNTCVPVEEEGFTENINWKIFRIIAEFVEGFEFLSKLKNEVTFFGSARSGPSDPYYQVARELGFLCGKNGYAVITGGGPGVMEAANQGAFESGGESVGINIMLPMEQRQNSYVRRSMGFHYFFTRKVMLSASAQAYVFFPGGFGTMDELFEMVTLIQTGKMSDQVPVILMGKAFWQPLLAWIRQAMADQYRYISPEDMDIFHLVDTAEEAFKIIKKTKERVL